MKLFSIFLLLVCQASLPDTTAWETGSLQAGSGGECSRLSEGQTGWGGTWEGGWKLKTEIKLWHNPAECTEEPLLIRPPLKASLMHYHRKRATGARPAVWAENVPPQPQPLCRSLPPAAPQVLWGSSPSVNKHTKSCRWYEPVVLCSRDRVHRFHQRKSPSPQGVAYYWNVLHFVFQEN